MRLSVQILLMFLIAGCDSGKTEQPPPPSEQALPQGGKLDRSHVGDGGSDTEFLDPDGEKVSLATFAGKPLLLNLWATWCAPCIAEMPTLNALAAREPDLQVIAVSQDIEGQGAKVAAFFEERKLSRLEPYRDPQLSLMTELNAAVLPTTILYDRNGREVWRMTGAADWTGPEAAHLLAEAQK